MKKKILFISPTPTHPTNAGNRQHIKSLVDFFKKRNWEVHFLYLAYEDYDEAEMRLFFGKNLYVITKKIIYQNKKIPRYVFQKCFRIMNRLKRRFQFHFGSINRNQFLYNKEVDDDFSVFVKPVIKDIQKRINFEIVVCEYASVSKSLDYFDRSVFKIMDTHDRFTDRFQIYLNNKVKPGWVSLFIDQERKALKRADLILAVHQKDAEYFASLSGKQTLVYNYVPENAHLNKKTPGKRLLYIASSNEINILTINSFIKNIFPLILKLHPEAKLIIGGDICEKLNVNHDSIFLKEILENLSAFYCSGDIVINPEISGTGYKVKALEALSYGMPLVATTAGAIGGCHPMMDHLFIANSPKEFAITIDNLFCNPSLLETTSKNAVKWIRAKKTEIDSSLALQILNVGKK